MSEFQDEPRQELIRAPNALEQVSRAEIDIQISTAKRFPRDEVAVPHKIEKTALRSRESAQEMFYALTRGKGDKAKPILGPSVRFAEIVATKWGNLRIQTRVMDVGDKDVTVCAIAHDLETNVAVSSEVKRRITYRDGGKYSDDMIIVTSNAASSIAFRNVVFKVVPKNIWEPVYQEAMNMAAGKKGPEMDKTRAEAIRYWESKGVSREKLLHKLGRATVEEIDQEDIVILRGFFNAIRDETATLEDIFNGDSPSVKRTINLAQRVEEPREPGSDG